MSGHKITLAAKQFEAHCLQWMDQVSEQGVEITITKHGQPVARLVPAAPEPPPSASLYGAMAGMATITGDLLSSLDESWDADQ